MKSTPSTGPPRELPVAAAPPDGMLSHGCDAKAGARRQPAQDRHHLQLHRGRVAAVRRDPLSWRTAADRPGRYHSGPARAFGADHQPPKGTAGRDLGPTRKMVVEGKGGV